MKRWVNPLLLGLSILLLPSFASAEITSPYIVDEKEIVMFGDSEVFTFDSKQYVGLQNFKQEYVNGYARFSFSYTHSGCCFASFPPRIYMTDQDPRISTSTTVKYDQEIYSLKSYWAGFGDPTDVYFFDIQFDETGFTKTVKRSGGEVVVNEHVDVPDQKRSDFVAIANRYPIHDPINEYSFSFTPVKVSTLPTEEKLNPVIIIPGIMGSAKKGDVWLIDPILHTYDDLIATLEANGYESQKNLFTFPYEWRDSNVETAKLLKTKISDVKEKCAAANLSDTDCSKIDIVAHSMGGLVARQYVQSSDYQNDVDQLIFLGTPHRGSPKAYLMWEAGEFPPGFRNFLAAQFFVSEARRSGYKNIFDYIRLRPILSVKELLPITDYLKDKNSGVLRHYPNNYPRNEFLESMNSNTDKLINSGIKITNIVGNTGSNTIETIEVYPSEELTKWEHGQEVGLIIGPGDNTVTIHSSKLNDEVLNEEWMNTSHDGLPKETAARIFELLTNRIADKVVYLSPVEKIFSIQLQSPIDVVVIDPDGRKVGKNFANGQEYSEIPGSFYSGFQTDEEYITIPNPLEGEYKIELQGTDNGGEYGVVTSLISEATSTTNEIVGISKPNQITKLITDINQQIITKTERIITLEIFKNDIYGAYDLGWIKDKRTRDVLIKQVESAVKLQKRIETIYEKLPNGKRKEKKIEKIEMKVNKILLKLFEKEIDILYANNKITQDALDLLKLDIHYLLNNN